MPLNFHRLALVDRSVEEVLTEKRGYVYNEGEGSVEFDVGAYEEVDDTHIRLTFVHPPITVADINKPPQRDEDDTIATRMEEWSGLPYPSDLLSEYRVASASPSCLCLRRKGQQDVSVVMLEFRPRALMDDYIPLSKEAADFLLRFRADPPADPPAVEPLRMVYTAWNDEWPQAEFATNAFAPEVHLYPDGSCGLCNLEHLARNTMIATSFDGDEIPGWLAIRVHSPGVFVGRDYSGQPRDEEARELAVELHEQYAQLRQPLPPLPVTHPRYAERQQQEQRLQQRERQQRQQRRQAQQPAPPPPPQPQAAPQAGGAAAAGAAAAAGGERQVWPAFRPASYLGELAGFRAGGCWRMGGTDFAALHLKGGVLSEGGTTVAQPVQTNFLGRAPADISVLTVHYGGTFAGGHFTPGAATGTLRFRVNGSSVKMTALNELLKAMRGGALPPEDSWLALVRHQDQIVAHIWPAGSNEANMLRDNGKRLTDEVKAAQLAKAQELQQAGQPGQRGAAAGQARVRAPAAAEGASSSEEEEGEEGEEEEEEEAARPAAGVARSRGVPAAAAARRNAADSRQPQPEGQDAVAARGRAAADGAAAANEGSVERMAATALGLLRQDQADVLAGQPPQSRPSSRQEREAARLAATRQQALAKAEAGTRDRDARAQARRQATEEQQRKRGTEQEAGPSQPPSKRQQRDQRQAAAASALAAAAEGRAAAAAGPSTSRPPPEQGQLQAAKRQRTGKQQKGQEQPAGLGRQQQQQGQEQSAGLGQRQQQQSRQQPEEQEQQEEQNNGQHQQHPGSGQLRQEATSQQHEQRQNGTAVQQQQQRRPQQAAGAHAAGAAPVAGTGAAAAAAAAAGEGSGAARLPSSVQQLLRDVLGGYPGLVASVASYLVAQRLRTFGDMGHVVDSHLLDTVPGLTLLLVRRLRWVWFARVVCMAKGVPEEEWASYEENYEQMQQYYASGAWGGHASNRPAQSPAAKGWGALLSQLS